MPSIKTNWALWTVSMGGLATVSIYADLFGELTAAVLTIFLLSLSAWSVSRATGLLTSIGLVYLSSSVYAGVPALSYLRADGLRLIEPTVYFGMALPLIEIYLISLVSSYRYLTKRRISLVGGLGTKRIPTIGRMRFICLYVLALCVLFLFLVRADMGVDAHALRRGDLQLVISTQARVVAALAITGLMYTVVVYVNSTRVGAAYPSDVRITLLLAAILFFVVSVLSLGDRRLFLSGVVAALVVLQFKNSQVRWILVAAIPVFLLFLTYSSLRDAAVSNWLSILESLDFLIVLDLSRGEFGGWARIAQDILSSQFDRISRLTVLEAPLAVIPSFLYPGRPEAPSLHYVRTFDPATADAGGAWAFSIVVESYMNFWWFGPLIFGAIIGSVLAFTENRLRSQFVVVFVLIFSFRLDVVSAIQMAGWATVSILFVDTIRRLRI